VLGSPVTFNVDAYPERLFTGTVKQIRKAPKTIQNIVTYVVVISTENPDEVLLSGMTANLQVVVAKRMGVLKVQTWHCASARPIGRWRTRARSSGHKPKRRRLTPTSRGFPGGYSFSTMKDSRR
jgi:hypothetical protein